MNNDIIAILKVAGINWKEYFFDPLTIELAEFMHDNYEEISKKVNWNTQEKCKVSFDKLPEENMMVMLEVANLIIQKYIKNSCW